MWATKPLPQYEKRCKRWSKKHRQEFTKVHERLNTVLKALNCGANPDRLPFGFIHPEKEGVVAIAAGGSGKLETRLYIYAYVKDSTLYVITLGDKQTQSRDVAHCRDVVQGILKEEQSQLETTKSGGRSND